MGDSRASAGSATVRAEALEGKARLWIAPYSQVEHLIRTRDWVLELDPGASEALVLAALTHDIERFFPGGQQQDRAGKPWDDPDYLRAHCERSAEIVGRWLREQGAGDDLAREVEELVRAHELGGSPSADLLQAADSISFLETLSDTAVVWVREGVCSPEKAKVKHDWMFERIRPAHARELARPLYISALEAVDRAAAALRAATDDARRFPSPFEIEAPEGAEDWRRLYPYYYFFSDERREFEDGKFWFFDSMHNPEVMYPFDTIMTESWWVALNQYTTRVWVIPPALGIDQRLVNGYLYVSPNTITDAELIEKRVAYFTRRAGYYYEHWDRLYDQWIEKAEDCIERLVAIEIEDLPEIEDERVVTEGRGLMSGYDLLTSYSRLLENMHEMAYYHFEMLNLGYAAYLTFRDFCQRAFPGIQDQTVAKMVVGIDILFFRPDDEVRRLARLAIELGLADLVKRGLPPEQTLADIGSAPGGDRWLAAFEAAKEPWFWYSTGSGYNHQHRAWMDDLRLPFNAMRGYVEKLEAGADIDRPLEELARERERVTGEYRELLPSDDDRKTFDDLVSLARRVYPYVENHNFYVEHWHHSIFWNKMRGMGGIFVAHGFLADSEDIFYLHRYEIYSALYDLETGWATSTPARGPTYWPPEVEARKRIMEKLRQWSPPPALGTPPESVNEPFTIMLWGITTDAVKRWLDAQDGAVTATELRGVAASRGVAEGRARVIATAEELDQLETGEILVCPITAPSWAPVFARIRAAVSDVGGIMAHASIVSREYGLPAVVGTGFGTKLIKTGQLIRVDGDTGVVTILE